MKGVKGHSAWNDTISQYQCEIIVSSFSERISYHILDSIRE